MNIPHRISRNLWVLLLSIVVFVPLVSWVYHAAFSSARTSSFLFLTLLGQFSGIIGAQLFAFSLLLGARLKSIEYLFGGLDRMYRMHHRIGVIAFSFLAVHPIVLAFRYLEDGMKDVMWFLLPINNSLARDFGIYSLLLMMLLLFITFYGVIFSYPKLKVAHKFMGAAFFLGILHIFIIPSSLSSDIVLKVSCLGTALVGCVAFAYRTLLGKFLVKRFEYAVSSVTPIESGVNEIVLIPKKEPLQHLPGQFAMLRFVGSSVVSDEEHPFTISSSSLDGSLRFSIKGLGDYTSLLSGLTVETDAQIEGPFGEFYYGYGEASQVWVAGGIGVTPFVSMVEELLRKDSLSETIDFFYSVRTKNDGAYHELFSSVSKKHPSFVYHFVPSDTDGYVTGESISISVADLKSRSIFVCGPPPMMKALGESLISLGVKERMIHMEKFSLLR